MTASSVHSREREGTVGSLLPRTVVTLLALVFVSAFGVLGPASPYGPVPVQGQNRPDRPAGDGSSNDTGAPGDTEDGAAASGQLPSLRAEELSGSLTLDGSLDDAAWEGAPVATGFVAQQPTEGALPEEPTEVRVLYDQDAIYVGARLFETEPVDIRDQLVRRDQGGQYDYFAVFIDSNLDRRTGYLFQVSARNVQTDALLFDDTGEDASWDAVWDSEVSRDARGWSVEIRIPLSQLRYDPSPEPQTWGINFWRRRVVSNEVLHFALVSRLQQGQVSQFGRVTGLQLTEPPGSLELVPYVSSTTRSADADPENPFFDGRESDYSVGGELTWNLGGNFNLNATFNPDFGQVESDPAVINLTAYETFFPERRPFFVEDQQLFDFPLSGGNRLFFSRRIGLNPTGGAPPGSEFSDIPRNTTILGAAKLTGRTSSGLSVGVLGALTQEEEGRAYFPGEDRTEEFLVEPQNRWAVVGLEQDYNNGDSQVGALLVGLDRDLTEGAAYGDLPSSAYGAGVNFVHRWSDREWALEGFFGSSHVRGDTAAIRDIQRNPNHYFQRPDARWVELDPRSTHLTGAEWRVRLERQTGEHWTGGVWLGEVSPEMAVNETGFSRDPESLNVGGQISYREIQPGDLFRSYQIGLFSTRDWSHDLLDDPLALRHWDRSRIQGRLRLNANLELLNFWRLGPSIGYYPAGYSRTETRGGPVMKVPGYWEAQLSLSTDQRDRVNLSPRVSYQGYREGAGHVFDASLDVEIRPRSNWEIRLGPSFTQRQDNTQYATTSDALAYAPTYGDRYIFADVDRRTLGMETRMDLAFSPNLTLQLFAQPFISSGDFEVYKQLSEPSTFRFDRFEEGTAVEIPGGVTCQGGRTCEDESHTRYLDFDGDGTVDDSFRDRDFSFRSLIVNAVLRWEFQNGSRLFLVWQRFQDERASTGAFSLDRDLDSLLGAPTENVFSVKVNYWVGL